MKKLCLSAILVLICWGFNRTVLCQESYERSRITVVSYLLRDRAVILDTLVMRKCLYIAFKTGHPLREVRKSAVAGELSHDGNIMAMDTTWLFDEAAGNLGFNLPYKIPDGTYKLKIKIINPSGKIVDTLTDEYDRNDLKAYFNREVQFWDFTTPYAHLECSGYGKVTWRFLSEKTVKGLAGLIISARMNSDSDYPAMVEVMINEISLGKFRVEAGAPEKSLTEWNISDTSILGNIAINQGENQLTFSVKPDTCFKGEGLRIYSHKNSSDPAIPPEVPISIRILGKLPSETENISIPVWGEDGEHITSKFSIPSPRSFTYIQPVSEKSDLRLESSDIERGYVLFNTDFMNFVYPWTIPAENERIRSLEIQTGRNDFNPVTFGIYPVRDLGNVKISISVLKGSGGNKINPGNFLIQVVQVMKIRTGGNDKYQLVPRLLYRSDHANIPLMNTTRFWLTLHTDSMVPAGKYMGAITIDSEKEGSSILPLTIDVLPVTLTAVPGIDYSMLLSYEFFEMESKEWSSSQKEKIYRDGVNCFRDYLNHGLTTVSISSPYYFQWNREGNPPLEHLKAMIKAAKEVGITRPVYWYLGHYLQAAKGQHPGNIRLYDPKVHPKRAGFLAKTALKINETAAGPPVGFMPIDEPRIAQRKKIALDLLSEIKKIKGTITMCTTDIGGKLLNIENNSQADKKPLLPGEKIRKSDRKVWEYNNSAIDCLNPGYSRYIYGYYTWRQDLDGMNSWGPGTSENSRGNPYEDLDNEFSDYFITYPYPGGPLATPNWEALREGIDDIRYIYQLEKLCSGLANRKSELVINANKFLDSVRDLCDFDESTIINDFGEWTPERFNLLRQQVIDWILKLQKE